MTEEAGTGARTVGRGARAGSRLARVGLLLLGVVLAALALEVVLRGLGPARLGFAYADGVFTGPPEFESDPFRNRFGFHDREHRRRKGADYRLLLLGDSYVAALSVTVACTVGQRLEHYLCASAPLGPGRALEVISVANEGWAQGEQLEALRSIGPRLDPDCVVLLFLSLNDVRGNDEALNRLAREQLETLDRFRPGWRRLPRARAPLFWFEGSVLNQLLSYRLAELLADPTRELVPLDYLVYTANPGPAWERAWDRTAELLGELDRFSREELGAPFVVFSASTPHGVLGAHAAAELLGATYPNLEGELDVDGPDRKLGELCAEAGIPFHPLEPELRRLTSLGRVLHWRRDGHWNEEGNDVAAESMARFLVGEGVLR